LDWVEHFGIELIRRDLIGITQWHGEDVAMVVVLVEATPIGPGHASRSDGTNQLIAARHLTVERQQHRSIVVVVVVVVVVVAVVVVVVSLSLSLFLFRPIGRTNIPIST